ncbi:hypothetical protein GGX14DRAFT_677371 [Mycena pura]|uniref:Carbamoyl phosphate synthase ATP-binding domain-containing protein n=1 Tax=Mycena pura TaxID=153505 RepID=A0AAD6UUL7_9AGAR|nr:hypothetical protein GGX14DRAFT_677371 [Mycena pura]
MPAVVQLVPTAPCLMPASSHPRKTGKHLAQDVAAEAVGPVSQAAALQVAARIGYSLMLKASAGGGGTGMAVCGDEHALPDGFTVYSVEAAR